MKKGTVIFKGDANDLNTYFLAIDERNIVWVYRNFKGDTNRCDRVPSGWRLEDVNNTPMLYIDGGQNWFVKPILEAWAEINELCQK